MYFLQIVLTKNKKFPKFQLKMLKFYQILYKKKISVIIKITIVHYIRIKIN